MLLYCKQLLRNNLQIITSINFDIVDFNQIQDCFSLFVEINNNVCEDH